LSAELTALLVAALVYVIGMFVAPLELRRATERERRRLENEAERAQEKLSAVDDANEESLQWALAALWARVCRAQIGDLRLRIRHDQSRGSGMGSAYMAIIADLCNWTSDRIAEDSMAARRLIGAPGVELPDETDIGCDRFWAQLDDFEARLKELQGHAAVAIRDRPAFKSARSLRDDATASPQPPGSPAPSAPRPRSDDGCSGTKTPSRTDGDTGG